MSELELSLFRQRSQEALKQKASRGALFLSVAAGYVKAGRDRIEKDPDQRVQEAIGLVFVKFAELQSVRQVHVWLREEGIALPVKARSECLSFAINAHDAEGRTIVWRLPAYNTVHNMITNPVYAGAYGGKAGRYHCEGALVNHGTARCISFGGLRADIAVGREVLRLLKPLGVAAAAKALEARTHETSAAQKQLELALAQTQFAAAHARRQYDAVDPDNRLVAAELERRWNEALQAVCRLEGEIAALAAKRPLPLGEKSERS